jgi:hypothetical protein
LLQDLNYSYTFFFEGHNFISLITVTCFTHNFTWTYQYTQLPIYCIIKEYKTAAHVYILWYTHAGSCRAWEKFKRDSRNSRVFLWLLALKLIWSKRAWSLWYFIIIIIYSPHVCYDYLHKSLWRKFQIWVLTSDHGYGLYYSL